MIARPVATSRARLELDGDLTCWCRVGPLHADLLLAVVAGGDPHQLDARAAVLARLRIRAPS